LRFQKTHFPENIQDETDINTIRFCNIDSNNSGATEPAGIELDDRIRTTQIANNWFESSQHIIVGASGVCNQTDIVRNKIQKIKIDNADKTTIKENFTESGGETLDIEITSNATETVLDDNELSGGSITNNGSRTRRLGQIVCALRLSANQSITPDGSFTRIEYDKVMKDTHNAWDTTNNEFTAPEDGIYFGVQMAGTGWTDVDDPAAIQFQSSALDEGRVESWVDVMGSTESGANSPTTIMCDPLSSGDVVYGQMQIQDSGSSIEIRSGRTRMLIMRVA